MNELVQKGMAALKSGDRLTARRLLASAVQQDTHDVTAWLWLAATMDRDEERMTCLQQVLKLDPGNQVAARGLAQILEHRTRAAAETVQKTAPAPAMPTPQVRPTPPPNTVRTYETPQPTQASPSDQAISQPMRIEPQPIPTPNVPPANVAPPPTVESWTAPEPAEPAESALRAEFAAYQPAPDEVDTTEEVEGVQEPAAEESGAYDQPAAWETAQPVPATVPIEPNPMAAPAQPARKRKTTSPDVLPTRVIFRTRPSMVPALLSFWLFFFGSVMVGNLLGKIPFMSTEITLSKGFVFPLNTLFAAGMGLLLELVVIYAALRILTVRYELTNHYLWVYFRGKRARVPLEHIYEAECHQSLPQKLISTGNLDLDLSVNGELAHVRLRNIPDCQKRMDQIMYLVREIA